MLSNMKKVAATFALILFFSFTLVSLPESRSAKLESAIYIRADGSVEGTDKIQRDGNVYTFTDNISISEFDSYGIVVERSNIVVDGADYTLQGSASWGLYISTKNNVIIKNINIKSFNHGIYLNQSWDITIEKNTVSGCLWGMHLIDSNDNTINGNTLINNRMGIKFEQSSTNILRNNHMSNNTYNFWVQFGGYVNDVDASNTVEGKPIYYWVEQHDKIVSADAGYVALVNCTGITVQNMNLINNGQGILLAYTKNSRIVKNTFANNMFGVELFHSSNNTIDGNTITNHNRGVWLDDSSNNNLISGNYLTKNERAISEGYQEPSISNVVSENNITANSHGILFFSNNTIYENSISANTDVGIEPIGGSCTIHGNNITDNRVGILLASSNNILRNNRMNNNEKNFYVTGGPENNVDSSNLVNGKPIYYWVNERDKAVPSDAGCVVLVKCTNITVQKLSLANNWEAIMLFSTTNSTITKNIITNVSRGITFYNSSDNHVIENNITNSNFGIYFSGPSYPYTVYFPSPNNIIYHNNFVNNQKHINDIIRFYTNNLTPINLTPPMNIWDNGSEGNYWSDYNGTDSNGDGIGDTSYTVYENNIDRYPLMYPVAFDITPPSISVISPQNVTYTTGSVSLNFTVNEETTWMGYSLDGQDNVTITETTLNLTELADGSHTVTVYATDTDGNTAATETISFTITKDDETPTSWTTTAIVIIAAFGAAILVYFLNKKKTTNQK
jgi:parallel beta-helix repeat protein